MKSLIEYAKQLREDSVSTNQGGILTPEEMEPYFRQLKLDTLAEIKAKLDEMFNSSSGMESSTEPSPGGDVNHTQMENLCSALEVILGATMSHTSIKKANQIVKETLVGDGVTDRVLLNLYVACRRYRLEWNHRV